MMIHMGAIMTTHSMFNVILNKSYNYVMKFETNYI